MTEPRWISRTALELLHAESIAIFGGAEGLRDSGLLDSALARPRNQFGYEPKATLASLAAAYAVGIARNHAFVDGNKRAALLALLVFLEINGYELVFDKLDAIQTMMHAASGELTEELLIDWIASRMRAK